MGNPEQLTRRQVSVNEQLTDQENQLRRLCGELGHRWSSYQHKIVTRYQENPTYGNKDCYTNQKYIEIKISKWSRKCGLCGEEYETYTIPEKLKRRNELQTMLQKIIDERIKNRKDLLYNFDLSHQEKAEKQFSIEKIRRLEQVIHELSEKADKLNLEEKNIKNELEALKNI